MPLPNVVLKFGGTSVRDAQMIRAAAGIVLKERARPGSPTPLVVVSAAGGVTNRLCDLLEAAQRGESEPILTELRARHDEILDALGLPIDLLAARFDELRDLSHGIQLLREVTPRTWDLVLSYGEFLLAPIFAAHLCAEGVPARAWTAGELGLVTDDRFTRARPLPAAYHQIRNRLTEADDELPVVTGFAGQTLSGEATTLGRGGSDYSASIIAKAVGARELQIWTDVDGILTADPRQVSEAKLIRQLDFGEASELAFSGAKVLHPQSITPAMEERIPVRVLNTYRPDNPGTLITDAAASGPSPICSIAHKTGVQVVTIISPRMVARHGFIARISRCFDDHGISIDMISTSEVSVSLTTEDTLIPNLLEELGEFATVEVEEGRGMISVVGRHLSRAESLFGDVFQQVAAVGSRVEMISYGATRTNLSFLVQEESVGDVVRALHRYYFE